MPLYGEKSLMSECPVCGKEFPMKKNKQFCSIYCVQKDWRQKNRDKYKQCSRSKFSKKYGLTVAEKRRREELNQIKRKKNERNKHNKAFEWDYSNELL